MHVGDVDFSVPDPSKLAPNFISQDKLGFNIKPIQYYPYMLAVGHLSHINLDNLNQETTLYCISG